MVSLAIQVEQVLLEHSAAMMLICWNLSIRA
jgi:hypothetical protein